MRKHIHWIGGVFAVALLILAAAGATSPATAQEAAAQSVTLTGQLAESAAGGYVLVEQESGDEVALEGPPSLGDYVGSNVHVTGTWAESSAGDEIFVVSNIEPASSES